MTATLDFASQLDYALALLPEIVLSTAACALLLVDAFQDEERGSGTTVRWLALGGVLAAAAANVLLVGVETGAEGILVALDSFRVVTNFLLLGTAFLTVLFSFDYVRREGLDPGEYHALVLFATVGMMFLAGAGDLILVFLGLEMMSIAAYVLTGFNRRDPRSAEAGLKYFLIGAFASAFFIFGIAFLYGSTGSTHLAAVTSAVLAGAGTGDPLLVTGTGLLLVGFGFKVAAVPFHMWAPDTYQGAPTPVTGYMAAGVKAAAFFALIRVVVVALEPVAEVWEGAVWWLAMLTMIVPNLVALAQDDVKRMLAYSSLAHAGYVLVGVGSGSDLGVSAALFYLVVYTLMTLGAFAVIYLVAGKGDRRSHLSDFRGMGWRRPVVGGVLVLFLLSLAGFPPTGGFVGKLYLLRAAVDGGRTVLAVTLVLTSLVAYYYYLRVVWKMYFEEAPEGLLEPDLPGRAFRLATGLCALGVLLAGVLPSAGISGAESAAADLRPAASERVEAPELGGDVLGVAASAHERPLVGSASGPAEVGR